MPNCISEYRNYSMEDEYHKRRTRKLVCKIYYKKVISNQRISEEVLPSNNYCECGIPNLCSSQNAVTEGRVWTRFNQKIICITKSVRKAENDFLNAVIIGKLDDVAKFLNSGVNPNVKDSENLTALHIVAERGDIKMAKCILNSKEVDVNVTTSNGDTPLISAVRYGRANVVYLLLNHGADPNISSNVGTTPLLIACAAGFVDIVKNLLLFHADPNDHDCFGDIPLIKAMIEHPNKVIVLLLLKYGANPNYRTMRKHPIFLELALHCSSKVHMEMVDILISYGVNINIQSSISKYTALHIASIGANILLIKHLLELGANMELLDFNGRTPMEIAREHGHTGLVNFFKSWKKQQEEIKHKECEIKRSAFANKNNKLGPVSSHTSARAVTFNDSESANDSNSNSNNRPSKDII